MESDTGEIEECLEETSDLISEILYQDVFSCTTLLEGLVLWGKLMAWNETALHKRYEGVSTEKVEATFIAQQGLQNAIVDTVLDRFENGHYNCEQMTWQWGRRKSLEETIGKD